MKKLILSSVLAVSGSLVMVGCTQANAVSETQTSPATKMQHKHAHAKKGEHRMGKRGGFETLNLTQEQKSQMKALRDAQKQNRAANQAQHKAQRQAMRSQTEALINSDTLNAAALDQLANQHAALSKQRFVERVQMQHGMAQILTDAQKEQLKQMRQQRSGSKGFASHKRSNKSESAQ